MGGCESIRGAGASRYSRGAVGADRNASHSAQVDDDAVAQGAASPIVASAIGFCVSLPTRFLGEEDADGHHADAERERRCGVPRLMTAKPLRISLGLRLRQAAAALR